MAPVDRLTNSQALWAGDAMICYKDTTFCRDWEQCIDGKTCPRALRPIVAEAANREGLFTSQFIGPPKCFRATPEHVADRARLEGLG